MTYWPPMNTKANVPRLAPLTSSAVIMCVVLAVPIGFFYWSRVFGVHLAKAQSSFVASSPLTQIIPSPRPSLAKGRFLVASEDLRDPNFAESVVVLTDYNENGAVGVIINRPTPVSLTTLLPKVKALQQRKDVAYDGGPVARHMMIILARSQTVLTDAQLVFADLYLVPGQETLEQVLQTAGTRAQLRAYLGHAGWAPGQLDMEVARGGWHVVPAEMTMIFAQKADEVWPELIRRGNALWAQHPHASQSLSLAFMMD